MVSRTGPTLSWPPPPPERTLDDILLSASTHPVYNALLDKTEPLSLSSFAFLTKAHFQATIQPMMNPPFLHSAYISPTGGTRTMDSVHLYIPNDITENRIQRYLFGHLLVESGTFPAGSIVLNLNGGLAMYRSGDLTGGLLQEAGATELAATSNAKPQQAIEIAERFHPNIVYATSSKLMELAVWAEGQETSYAFGRALFTAEPLSDKQETFMRRVLGIKELGSLYGSAECGPVGICPPSEDKSRSFIVDKRQFVVEIVSAGQIVAISTSLSSEDSRAGEIALTSLVRHRSPMVRYRTGDYGSLKAHPTNSSWVLMTLHGRDPEKSFTVDTDYIDISEIEKRVMDREEGKGVLEWQVVVSEGPKVEFRVVLDSSASTHAARAEALRLAIIKEVLGQGLAFTVRPVGYDDLERGSTARKVRKTVDTR